MTLDPSVLIHVACIFSAALAIGLAAVGCGLGMGRAIGSALESMAKQPEILGELRFTMIIGLALIESLAIYCLLTALIFLFVKW